MKNQNWRFLSGVIAVAVVTLLVVSFTTLAVAQRIGGEERDAIFAGAAKVATSVGGVTIFAAPPKGFNPLTATNQQLLSYGLPQAPDQTADPQAYQLWQRAMSAVQSCNQSAQQQGRSTSTSAQACHATDVKALPYSTRPMQQVGEAAANLDGTTANSSNNWSGIANTNKNKTWKATTSFDEVVSFWNVPFSNHAFGNLPCTEGPWVEATWNGIDGFNNGDVVQGGSEIYWDDGGCGGAIQYYGWVEWWPSYPTLEIYCNGNPCTVGPGDDFAVITYGAAGFATQSVFVEDITQQWSGTFSLPYVSGPGLVGNSAEYIVERPCCTGSNYTALANYILEFFNFSYAYDVAGKQFYPGSASATTNIITMEADAAPSYQDISFPASYGTGGNQGKFSIVIEDEGCAFSGGCAP